MISWRIIVVLLTIMLMLGSCTRPSVPTPTPPPPLGPAPTPGPEIFIEAEASMKSPPAYLPGEEVTIEFSFKNITSELFELDPFPPQIEIMRPSPYDEPVRSFTSGTEVKSLEPGEVASYIVTWDQLDDQRKQVRYGRYYFKLGDIRHGGGWMSLGFHRYVWLLILPPEGVIEKEIQVNQSQTVNGITFTLEKVVLSDLEAMFWAFNTPPNYNLPQGPDLPPPQFMIHAEAEYSLDGGSAKKTEPSGIRFYDEGVKHSWKHLDPLPKGTREIRIVITRLGDWEGPWEFQVPIGLTIEEVKHYTDENKTISIDVGEEFAIALYSNPRLGFNWYADYGEKILDLVESQFVAKDKLMPVDGTRYFHFKALKAGKTKITVSYRQASVVKEKKVFQVDIQ